MPKRVAVRSIVLHRAGKPVRPEVGQVFDFTAEELEEINRMNPLAVRKPVNEDPEAPASTTAPKKADPKKDEPKKDDAI